MEYRLHKLVKVILKFEETEFDLFKKVSDWMRENEIYPASRGGGGSWRYNAKLYKHEDAEKIKEYLKLIRGKNNNFLKS